MDNQKKLIAVEIKSASAPQIPKGFYIALDNLKINKAFIVAPVSKPHFAGEKIYVCGIAECVSRLLEIL